jgi:hypothetical protein
VPDLTFDQAAKLRVAQWLAYDYSPCGCRTAEDRWEMLASFAKRDYLAKAEAVLRIALGTPDPEPRYELTPGVEHRAAD